jgi:hypothetical protein
LGLVKTYLCLPRSAQLPRLAQAHLSVQQEAMAKLLILSSLTVSAFAGSHVDRSLVQSSTVKGWTYDPENPSEPFDNVAQVVSDMIHKLDPVDSRDEKWQGKFCSCMENGHISSWYQYASAMYLIDSCSPTEGLVLRTGHLQDRHTEPLQGMMACDTLKLISYCLSHSAPEALPTQWKPVCKNAHYTIAACDVDCSGAGRAIGGRKETAIEIPCRG